VPAQNMVIVVETAAQCRRIQQIVQTIDDVKPVDSAFGFSPSSTPKPMPATTRSRG
jgi:hypothetical protein